MAEEVKDNAIIQKIVEGMTVTAKDADTATMEIVSAIMNAGSAEEVFAPSDLISPESILDQPIRINGFKVNSGDFGSYFVIDAQAVGELFIDDELSEDGKKRFGAGDKLSPGISCGSVIVMAQLAKAQREEWLPYVARFTERETGQGYHVLRLIGDRSAVHSIKGAKTAAKTAAK